MKWRNGTGWLRGPLDLVMRGMDARPSIAASVGRCFQGVDSETARARLATYEALYHALWHAETSLAQHSRSVLWRRYTYYRRVDIGALLAIAHQMQTHAFWSEQEYQAYRHPYQQVLDTRQGTP